MKGVFVGIDIAYKPLRKAKRILVKYGYDDVDFTVCSVENIPFKTESFDIITGIFGALDHTKYYLKVFHEISRLLKKGGIFVFTVLNKFALDWITKVIINPRLYIKTIKKAKNVFTRVTIPLPGGGRIRIPTHYYNPLEVLNILRKVGMKPIRKYGIFSILPANFREKKFRGYHKILCKWERKLTKVFPFNILGRYLGIIAIKMNE